MKKMITIVFILGALSLVYQFFAMFIMNKHSALYSLKTNDNSYMISENFKKDSKYHMYYLQFTDNEENHFVDSINIDLNRQSRIIKNVKSYQNNNLKCIAPILKNKSITNILCNLDNQEVSLSYLKQIGNSDVNQFIDTLKKDGYTVKEDLDKDTQIVKTYGNISIYNDLDPNIYITMWGYNGTYILNNANIIYKDFLHYDYYENKFSRLVGKYYVSIDTDSDDYGSFYVVNIKDGGVASIDSDFNISKNGYFNGIYKNALYYTDIDNQKQYIYDPVKEEIRECSSNNQGKYYDGENLVDIDINELTSTPKYFVDYKIDTKLQEKYPDKQFVTSLGNKYYLDSDGSVYKIIDEYYDYKVLLFKFNDFKELKVVNNNVYGISGDTVYQYSDDLGLRKVAYNRELLYNYKNIYGVYEK